jgi:predicted transcriptional regulator YheO
MGQTGRRARQLPDRDADQRLRAIADIIGPLTQSLGSHCEMVLHDYRIPDKSVVAIAGKVTERRVGSAVSEIGLSILAEGSAAQDRLNYLTKAPNGRVINSSTIVLRDENRKVFGALCINMDVTELRHASAVLSALIGDYAQPKPTTFTDDIRDVINVALRDELGGRSPATLSRDERLEITRALDARGVFNIKRGMGQVAAALGVSRATAYACLQIVRAGTSGVANTGDSAPVGRPGRRRVASVSR